MLAGVQCVTLILQVSIIYQFILVNYGGVVEAIVVDELTKRIRETNGAKRRPACFAIYAGAMCANRCSGNFSRMR